MDAVKPTGDAKVSGRRLAELGHPSRAYANAATLAYVLSEVRSMKANAADIRERAPIDERAYRWACAEIDCRAGSIESMLRGRLLDLGVDPGVTAGEATNAWRALNEAVYCAVRE